MRLYTLEELALAGTYAAGPVVNDGIEWVSRDDAEA